MDLGERLAAWLKTKGKSQRQLALALKINPSAVSLWVTGRTTPSQANLAAAAKWLGLSMEEFYGAIPKAKKRAAA